LGGGAEAEWRDGEPVRMREMDGRLIAIGFYDAVSRCLRPRIVLFPENKI
jgi:hypothetical protein